jgi:hypothetical protein
MGLDALDAVTEAFSWQHMRTGQTGAMASSSKPLSAPVAFPDNVFS